MNDKFSQLPTPEEFSQFVTWPGLEDALRGIRTDFEGLAQPQERVVIEMSSQTEPVSIYLFINLLLVFSMSVVVMYCQKCIIMISIASRFHKDKFSVTIFDFITEMKMSSSPLLALYHRKRHKIFLTCILNAWLFWIHCKFQISCHHLLSDTLNQ